MGRGADRERAAAETRHSGVPANDPELYVEVSAGDGYTSGRPAVGDFFLRNHARGIIACDFCVAVTATFRVLYVLVVMEHALASIDSPRGDCPSYRHHRRCHSAPLDLAQQRFPALGAFPVAILDREQLLLAVGPRADHHR